MYLSTRIQQDDKEIRPAPLYLELRSLNKKSHRHTDGWLDNPVVISFSPNPDRQDGDVILSGINASSLFWGLFIFLGAFC
jgi:hypothetical protein